MGRKYVLVDDLDGTELPDDTRPINLTLGRSSYSLYLSDDNHAKLLEAVGPFIENAEKVTGATATVKSAATADDSGWSKTDKQAARYWAIETGFEYPDKQAKNKDGSPLMKKVGDRGRVPTEALEAWEKAGSPAIGS